jgi:hypothetical protein
VATNATIQTSIINFFPILNPPMLSLHLCYPATGMGDYKCNTP